MKTERGAYRASTPPALPKKGKQGTHSLPSSHARRGKSVPSQKQSVTVTRGKITCV